MASEASARVDGPTTAVSAATVTVRRDDAETSTSSSTPAASVDAEPVTEPDATPPAEKPVIRPVAEDHVPATQHAAEPGDAAPAAVAAPDPVDVITVAATTATAARSAAAAPAAAPTASARPAPGPVATAIISILSIFGLLPNGPPVPVDVVGLPVQPQPGTSATAGVTGVVVGSSSVAIPVGSSTDTAGADWYFPTQAACTVRA